MLENEWTTLTVGRSLVLIKLPAVASKGTKH